MSSEENKTTYEVYVSNIKPGATKKDLLDFLRKGVDIADDAIKEIVFRERSAIISFTEKELAERVIGLNGLPWNGDPAEEKKIRISWAPPALPARPPSSPSLALPRKPRRKWLRAILFGLAIVSVALLVFYLLSKLKGVESPDQIPVTPLDQRLDQQMKELEQLLDAR